MRIVVLCVVTLSLLAAQAQADPVAVDLSTWTVMQYDLTGQGDANWALSADNTEVIQTVNADASIMLSDFDIAGTAMDGAWEVQTTSDDDFIGFVFGYQDEGSYYLFDWKQRSQSAYGYAEVGMSVKVVNAGGADLIDSDLWQSAGSERVSVLRHNTIPWQDNTEYQFHLAFFPGTFQIEVKQGDTVLQSWSVSDNTYADGKFGFYNFSQGRVRYAGFTQEDDPPPPPPIPEPITAAVTILSLGGIGTYLRKRRAAC